MQGQGKKDKNMRYSFIVPAYNEAKYIEKCINSIRRAIDLMHWNIAPHSTEIIVVDDNSLDNCGEIARKLGAKIICSNLETDSIAGVRNCGAAVATGDYLFFVDADTCIDFELLKHVDFSYVAGGALLSLDNITWLGQVIINAWNQYAVKNKIFTGCFIWVQRDWFFAIGQFDEKLFICEDVDFSNRINKESKRHGQNTQLIKNTYVITSDRKLRLFSIFEHLWFWIYFRFNREKTITTRSLCSMWYSGRR